jgi:hypothetical protein
VLQKIVWRLLKKLKIDLPYDPAILLLGIYLTECKVTINAPAYVCLFQFLTIDELLKWPRCHTTDDWNRKMSYLYTMEFYSDTKKKEICLLQVNGWNWRT